MAQICSGPSSQMRQCVAEDLVTRIVLGPFITHSPFSFCFKLVSGHEVEVRLPYLYCRR